MVMSDMIGPMEQMALANHLVKVFYFMTTGGPQVPYVNVQIVCKTP